MLHVLYLVYMYYVLYTILHFFNLRSLLEANSIYIHLQLFLSFLFVHLSHIYMRWTSFRLHIIFHSKLRTYYVFLYFRWSAFLRQSLHIKDYSDSFSELLRLSSRLLSSIALLFVVNSISSWYCNAVISKILSSFFRHLLRLNLKHVCARNIWGRKLDPETGRIQNHRQERWIEVDDELTTVIILIKNKKKQKLFI